MSEYAEISAECHAANVIAARLRGGPAYVRQIREAKQARLVPHKARQEVTAAQLRVLDYMRAFLAENDELPPYWAICQHFGWAALNSAQGHVEALGRKGLLERNEIGNWRITRAKEAAQ